jgi:hypothetical protein
VCFLLLAGQLSWAQQSAGQATSGQETPAQELRRLTVAVEQAQAQVEASQQQLLELKKSLAALEQRFAQEVPPGQTPAAPPLAAASPSSDEDVRERQEMQQSQIATLDQVKVESESKYPVKVSGLILFNGFVNTSQVDIAAAPAMAVPGSGSTGASLRQTVLGIEARGPTLAGATSHADLHIDFFGSTTGTTAQTSYGGGLLRLRTAHATLDWAHTQAFIEMDRPIVSPNVPTSLVAVAEPALAWSGNLWTWSPQVGVTHTLDLGASWRLALEAALIDVPDPPAFQTTASTSSVSLAEHSRWPGTEVHLGLLGNGNESGPAIGVGGYFGPHKTPGGADFDAWAGTMDLRLPLPARLELSGSFYRGSSLGGLGGGAYKDYLGGGATTLALDDVGGWAQLKERVSERLEFNGAFGMDNSFSHELRKYSSAYTTGYQSLARNQTFYVNTIYSPKAYLLFSTEVRRILSSPVTGPPANSYVIGVGAGYKF